MDYYKLLSFGDVIKLTIEIEPKRMFNEIKHHDHAWAQYNPRKNNNRKGLSITSSDGTFNNIDLDSIYEYNSENNTSYSETSFKTKTPVYYDSKEIQTLVDPFDKYLCRSHLINLRTNGSFPPHRDWRSIDQQESFRIFVPLKHCDTDNLFFMYDGRQLMFDHGSCYFINTNKNHCLFSFSDNTIFIVLNIECHKDSLQVVLDNMTSS